MMELFCYLPGKFANFGLFRAKPNIPHKSNTALNLSIAANSRLHYEVVYKTVISSKTARGVKSEKV